MIKSNVIILYIVIFFVVYGPVIDSRFGALFDISFLTCVFIILLNIVKCSRLVLDQFTFKLSVFLVFIFVISLSSAVLLDVEHIEHSMRAIMRPVRVLPTVVSLALLSQYIINNRKNQFTIESGITIVFCVIVLHAIIMIVQFFNEPFRNAIYQFTTAKYVIESYQATRIAGFAGAGGAQLSIAQSFGLVLGVYLFVSSKSLKFKFFIFLLCQLLLGSIFLTGRSGLLTAFIFCPLYFIYLNLLESGSKAIKNILIAFLGVSICLGSAIFILFDALADNPMFMSVFNRIFDTFIGYNEGVGVKINTVDVLMKMFILPNEVLHLIFGKASYLNNNTLYGIFTDIGYFRLVWGYGLLGSLFHYGFYIFAMYTVLNLQYIGKREKSIPLLLLLLTLFFNSKEILIFTKFTFQICMLSLFLIYFSNKAIKKSLSYPQGE